MSQIWLFKNDLHSEHKWHKMSRPAGTQAAVFPHLRHQSVTGGTSVEAVGSSNIHQQKSSGALLCPLAFLSIGWSSSPQDRSHMAGLCGNLLWRQFIINLQTHTSEVSSPSICWCCANLWWRSLSHSCSWGGALSSPHDRFSSEYKLGRSLWRRSEQGNDVTSHVEKLLGASWKSLKRPTYWDKC